MLNPICMGLNTPALAKKGSDTHHDTKKDFMILQKNAEQNLVKMF